jgi:hypothetical protein
MAVAAAAAAVSACEPPLGLGLPSTRVVENGAAHELSSATRFIIRGSYTDASGAAWKMYLAYARPGSEDVTIIGPTSQVEAIVIGSDAYFSGHAFLAEHMPNDPVSRNLVKAAGSAWWKGSPGLAPQLPDLTDGNAFRSTFLGSAVTRRTDHVSMDGLDAIELSGPRADVFLRAQAPYYVLRVHLKKGVVIDGLGAADLDFSNFNRNFEIKAPADVIDFSNLSTLPPIYYVVSVDASACALTCAVSAVVRNLGGLSGAQARSTVTFTMSAAASGEVIGTCHAPVTPDVGYNATTRVSCTIASGGLPVNAAIVSASADNPGRA